MNPDPRQVDLFGAMPEFDGATYEHKRDHARLSGQLLRIYQALQDGEWWTLRSLAYYAKSSEASASARLRDLRKPKFGAFVVERRRVSDGLFEYKLSREN